MPFEITTDVNLFAVFGAAVVSMIVGSVWYGPLFGKQWMKLMGFTQDDIAKAKQKGMAKSYIVMFIGSLVMAFVLANLIGNLGGGSIGFASMMGFWMWLGFVATIQIGMVLWDNKPMNLFWMNSLYWLVNIILMSIILTVWS